MHTERILRFSQFPNLEQCLVVAEPKDQLVNIKHGSIINVFARAYDSQSDLFEKYVHVLLPDLIIICNMANTYAICKFC